MSWKLKFATQAQKDTKKLARAGLKKKVMDTLRVKLATNYYQELSVNQSGFKTTLALIATPSKQD